MTHRAVQHIAMRMLRLDLSLSPPQNLAQGRKIVHVHIYNSQRFNPADIGHLTISLMQRYKKANGKVQNNHHQTCHKAKAKAKKQLYYTDLKIQQNYW